jgi:nitrogen regulatory protein P-II 1
MKRITAVIQPWKLDETVDALRDVGVSGITLREVRGAGRQRGHTEVYRGAALASELLPKVLLELVVSDAVSIPAIHALARAARTGRVGDGKILVEAVDDAVRIRTGERGDAAVA